MDLLSNGTLLLGGGQLTVPHRERYVSKKADKKIRKAGAVVLQA